MIKFDEAVFWKREKNYYISCMMLTTETRLMIKLRNFFSSLTSEQVEGVVNRTKIHVVAQFLFLLQLPSTRFAVPDKFSSFLAPVVLVLIINTIAFILIIRSLLKSGSKVAADKRATGLQQARRASAIMVVLGLTWLFGVLAVRDAKLIFQYLFCIFNSIQGLLVFILLRTFLRNQSEVQEIIVFKKYRI